MEVNAVIDADGIIASAWCRANVILSDRHNAGQTGYIHESGYEVDGINVAAARRCAVSALCVGGVVHHGGLTAIYATTPATKSTTTII